MLWISGENQSKRLTHARLELRGQYVEDEELGHPPRHPG